MVLKGALSHLAEQRMLEAAQTDGVPDCGGQTEKENDLVKADTWPSVSILSQYSS